jgi:hypothetical protein
MKPYVPNVPSEAVQTAEQTNSNQLGTLKIIRTESRRPVPEPRPAKAQGVAGKSWCLRSLRDTRENVIEAIQHAATLPEEAKALLIAAINEHHVKSRLICVDAHCQVMAGPDGRVKHHGCWDISEI